MSFLIAALALPFAASIQAPTLVDDLRVHVFRLLPMASRQVREDITGLHRSAHEPCSTEALALVPP